MIPDWPFEGNARTEASTPRDGFLSTTVEIHAVAIGAIFALLYVLTGAALTLAFFALLIMGKAKVSSVHLQDAAREAAYSGTTFAVVWASAQLVIHP